MFSKKARATDCAEYGWLKAMKCAILENRLTMVRMTDLPPTRRKPSTKSMAMDMLRHGQRL